MADRRAAAPDRTDADAVRDHLREHMTTDDPAALAASAVDELAEQAAELERLRAEVASLNDQLLRRAAEFQNYRRRSEAQRADDDRAARAATLTPLLDVYDDLARALGVPPDAPDAAAAFRDGIELVYRKFEAALGALGVERIEAAGAPFSEEAHEAILQQPADDQTAPGTVVTEVQPGYRMGERVLRHARVIVAA